MGGIGQQAQRWLAPSFQTLSSPLCRVRLHIFILVNLCFVVAVHPLTVDAVTIAAITTEVDNSTETLGLAKAAIVDSALSSHHEPHSEDKNDDRIPFSSFPMTTTTNQKWQDRKSPSTSTVYDTLSSQRNTNEVNHHIVPSSPECWKSAIQIFQSLQEGPGQADATKLCQVMPEGHQKRLALEIARCHLEDLGRPLFKNATIEHFCVHGHVHNRHEKRKKETSSSSVDVLWCLKHLTDYGVNAYTQHFAYVSSLCIRLTQELVVSYQKATQDDLAHRYAEISSRSVEQLESITSLTRKHADHMEALSRVPELVEFKIKNDLRETLMQTVEHYLGEQLKLQMNMFDEQVKVIEATMSKTTNSIQPLLKFYTLFETATQRYEWMYLLLKSMGAFSIVWIVTRPQCCQSVQSHLFASVLIETVIEISLMKLIEHDIISVEDGSMFSNTVRWWTLVLQCTIYIIGFLASCMGLIPSDTAENKSSRDHSNEQLFRELEKTLARANQAVYSTQTTSTPKRSVDKATKKMIGGGNSEAQHVVIVSKHPTPTSSFSHFAGHYPLDEQTPNRHVFVSPQHDIRVSGENAYSLGARGGVNLMDHPSTLQRSSALSPAASYLGQSARYHTQQQYDNFLSYHHHGQHQGPAPLQHLQGLDIIPAGSSPLSHPQQEMIDSFYDAVSEEEDIVLEVAMADSGSSSPSGRRTPQKRVAKELALKDSGRAKKAKKGSGD